MVNYVHNYSAEDDRSIGSIDFFLAPDAYWNTCNIRLYKSLSVEFYICLLNYIKGNSTKKAWKVTPVALAGFNICICLHSLILQINIY